MIKEYKVVKGFDSLNCGDVLKYDEICDLYVFESEISNGDYTSSSYVTMNRGMVEEFAKSGLLEPQGIETKEESEKITKLKRLIASLKNTYTQRNNSVKERYEKGKIQPCVKVEHDTVHFNLMKLLNKFEEIINE